MLLYYFRKKYVLYTTFFYIYPCGITQRSVRVLVKEREKLVALPRRRTKNFARRAALQHLQIQGCATRDARRTPLLYIPTFSRSLSYSPNSGGRAANLEPAWNEKRQTGAKRSSEDDEQKTKLRAVRTRAIFALAQHAALSCRIA